MKRSLWIIGLFMAGLSVFMTSCDEDDSGQGRVKVYLTDAPIDDPNVEAAVLSINRIEMRGSGNWQTVKEFDTPFSLNILDYQNGESYFVTEEVISAGTYSEARLILNAPEDTGAPVTNPGCFLRFKDGTQMPLFIPSGGQTGYKVKGSFTLPKDGTVAVTLDFDARRSIVETSGKFILKPTVRLVANADAAVVDGNFAEVNQYSKVIAYAYEKDTYVSSESTVAAEGEARFSNAATSATVAATGDFMLAFLSPGEYDIVFAAHSSDGEFSQVIGRYNNVSLAAGAELELNISLSLLIN